MVVSMIHCLPKALAVEPRRRGDNLNVSMFAPIWVEGNSLDRPQADPTASYTALQEKDMDPVRDEITLLHGTERRMIPSRRDGTL